MKHLVAALSVAALAAVIPATPVQAAPSDFGLASVTASLSTHKAGAHPDFSTTIAVKEDPASEPNTFGLRDSYAATRDIRVTLPPGLLGNPNAVEHCTIGQLEVSLAVEGESCPNGSQVGVTTIYAYGLNTIFTEPIYMMEPPGGDVAARLGFIAGIYPTIIDVEARPDRHYSLTANLNGVNGQQRLVKAETTLWGVPAATIHDTERMTPLEAFNGASSSSPRPPGGPPVPFMYNPTSCGVAQTVEVSADSYSLPGQFSTVSAGLPPTSGCEELEFHPSLSVRPTSRQAAAPTGLEADLSIPQDETVNGHATSQLRDAVVALPPGMTIASGAADGLQACTPQQVGFEQPGASHCPEAAKIGTAEFDVPALSRVIHGAIYQRTPEPRNLFRIWLVTDELGVHVKLSGDIRVDKQTGQVTSLFLDNPQVPLRELKLDFRSGPRAPLANPFSCGTYQTRYELAPWSGLPAAVGQSPMTIDQGCGTGGFSPRLSAGSVNPSAGDFSTFVTNLSLASGEQNVSGLNVTLPPGVLAKLAGVPLCPPAEAESGSCPSASQVGTTTVAAGPGSAPLWIPQPGKEPTAIYLAGPYRGAPYSLVVSTPAQAGPFDLGTVVVRAGIYVDPTTAQVTVRSDPFPQILEGVPITYRTIQVDVSRPSFTLNPTNCSQMAVQSTVTSAQGAIATPSSRFQVGGCRGLGFAPKLVTKLSGGTRRSSFPSLKATLTLPAGGANVAHASVALPHSEFLEQNHIGTICTRVQFAARECPARSVYGKVRAFTPLLDQPLEGPVYLRSSSHELPDLVGALRGPNGLELAIAGRIDSIHGGIRTTFEVVPDAPVAKFVITMQGGKKGLLVNSRNLCNAPSYSTVKFTGQNGKTAALRPRLKNDCGKQARGSSPGGIRTK